MRKIQSLFLIVLSLPACSFLKAPPTTANQQDAIAAAVTVAVPACLQLGKAIKPGEVDKLRASLVFVGAALQADGERAELAINAPMTSNNAAAPYAPVVAAIVQLAINRVPEDARKSTAAEIGKGVVSGCLVGLGQV